MKYLVTVETLSYQDYIVEADSEEEAREYANLGDYVEHGDANAGHDPQIIALEKYLPRREV